MQLAFYAGFAPLCFDRCEYLRASVLGSRCSTFQQRGHFRLRRSSSFAWRSIASLRRNASCNAESALSSHGTRLLLAALTASWTTRPRRQWRAVACSSHSQPDRTASCAISPGDCHIAQPPLVPFTAQLCSVQSPSGHCPCISRTVCVRRARSALRCRPVGLLSGVESPPPAAADGWEPAGVGERNKATAAPNTCAQAAGRSAQRIQHTDTLTAALFVACGWQRASSRVRCTWPCPLSPCIRVSSFAVNTSSARPPATNTADFCRRGQRCRSSVRR